MKGKVKNMSVLFSKVTLRTEAGATRQFLCTGAPKNYTYGEGEVCIATIYEVASYTQRGERFFRNPNVKRVGTAEFRC